MSFIHEVKNNYQLIAALKKIVEADFTSAKKTFLYFGVDEGSIDSYFKEFKELRDQNKIKDVNKRNIDFWVKNMGNQSWADFKAFIIGLKLYTKSKSKSEKEAKQKGAKLVYEDTNWQIYQILTAYGLHIYSKGTKWCINSLTSYPLTDCFYILISKKYKIHQSYYYKIAVHLTKGAKLGFWNALNKPFDPKEDTKLNLPDFKYEWFEHE